MTKHLKYGVSAVALSLMFAAHPAAAFNEVDWSWNNDVDQHVHINVGIDAGGSLYPTGLTQIEQLQVSAGSVSASSNQDNTSFAVNRGNVGGNFNAVIDLGRLEGNATAAANLASINSDATTTFHDGQIAFGSFGRPEVPEVQGAPTVAAAPLSGSDNRNFDALVVAALGGLFGVIQPGTVTADASAVNVSDAQVALNATGAGNLHTVSVGPSYNPYILAAAGGGEKPRFGTNPAILSDSVVIGDLNQFNLMNVSATADASGLTVTGYDKMGRLKDQYGNWTAVSSVNASAFGNMSSVTNRVGGLAPLPYAPK